MTKEEILAMKAGSGLDAVIAEHIFDQQVNPRQCWQEPECGHWVVVHSQKFGEELVESHKGWGEELVKQLPCYCVNKEYDIWDVVPFYSTDISATWQVVEKMRALDTYIEIGNGWQPGKTET